MYAKGLPDIFIDFGDLDHNDLNPAFATRRRDEHLMRHAQVWIRAEGQLHHYVQFKAIASRESRACLKRFAWHFVKLQKCPPAKRSSTTVRISAYPNGCDT